MTSVMKRSLNHLPCFVNNAFLERRDDVCEEKAVRLATLPNMRVDASLNAIGVFMFSSTLNVVVICDGCGSSQSWRRSLAGCEAFQQPFFCAAKTQNLSFFCNL